MKKKNKHPVERFYPQFKRKVFVTDDFDRTARDFFVSPEINGKVLVLHLWNTSDILFDPPIIRNKDGSVQRVLFESYKPYVENHSEIRRYKGKK
jgi:hypothetical protein